MRILLTQAASINNRGDAAIFATMISSLKSVFPEAVFAITTIDEISINKFFEGVERFHSFFYEAIFSEKGLIKRFAKTSYILFLLVFSIFLYSVLGEGIKVIMSKRHRGIFEKYRDSNLVISVGGGIFSARAGAKQTAVIFVHILELLFARTLKKTVIIYPQSFGPFGNKVQEFSVRFLLKRLNAVFVRESISYNILKNWGIKNIYLVPDSAFLFTPNNHEIEEEMIKSFGLIEGNNIIGFTGREWLASKDSKIFETELVNFFEHIVMRGYQIILIPQVVSIEHGVDDREVLKSIYCRLRDKDKVTLVENPLNHMQLKYIYKNLKMLVGMRMHSIIFALTSGVPVMAIEYEHKTRGVMRDLGLEEWVSNINEVRAEILIKKFEDLVNSHEKYIEKLKKTIPEYIENAKLTPNKLKQIYHQHVQS